MTRKVAFALSLPLVIGLALSGCSAGGSIGSGPGLQPIPGSITYGGQPRTKLTKAPIGSTVEHEFNDGSRQVIETYVIEPDRSLRLTSRRYRPPLISFDN